MAGVARADLFLEEYDSYTPQLTPKQLDFCCYYVELVGNGTQAAIKAGYSPKTAHVIAQQNLRLPAILEQIDDIKRRTGVKANITPDFILHGLAKIYKITSNKRSKHFNGAVANRSLELLGKTFEMFSDKHTVDIGENALTAILAQIDGDTKGIEQVVEEAEVIEHDGEQAAKPEPDSNVA